MRLQILIGITLTNIFTCVLTAANAQNSLDDSIAVASAKQHAIDIYHENIGSSSGLYNGAQYVIYAQTIDEGIPYFETTELQQGSVVYYGILYKNVPLLYDIIKSKVITRVASSNYLIQLNDERVSSFTIAKHNFVRIVRDSADKSFKTGFYEELYNGITPVYKKQIKTIGEDLSSNKLRRYIIEEQTFYIKKDNKFYTITSKSSLLNVLKDKKKQIQEFIKKNELNIRKDKDNALPAIASYYDELVNAKN